jgi:hypothetical protein
MNLRPPVIFAIDKFDVERFAIEEPLRALNAMAATAATTRDYAGRVEFMFSGYENDPRELYSIHEVRKFVRALTEKFPYWFHFCTKSGDSLWVVVQCLLPVGLVTVVDGVATTAMDTDAWNSKTSDLFGFMNGLYHHHGLSQEENSETTRQVLQYVRRFMRN